MSAARRLALAHLALPGLVLAGLGAPGCGPRTPPPEAVAEVDLDRYLGTWYEIARLPAFFQRGCTGTTATYSWRADGRIRVVNRCKGGSLEGEPREVEGVAWPVEGSGGGRLKVQFFPPFAGDYWILALDPDYRWAVVGTPARDYLWLLARAPRVPEATYDAMVARAAAQGFDVSRLERTPQPADAPPADVPAPAPSR